MGLDLDLGFQNTNMNGFQNTHSLNTTIRVSRVVSQPRLWTKILQWAGSSSATFRIRSATSQCLSAALRSRFIIWSLLKGSRRFCISSSSPSAPAKVEVELAV
nr:hypothetical protein CFP56_61476 [Quercus suber]